MTGSIWKSLLFVASLSLLAACAGAESTATPTSTLPPIPAATATTTPAPTATRTSRPTLTQTHPPTPTQTHMPTPTLPHTHTPNPTPTPTPTSPAVHGYWIQNSTPEGLCTDTPRLIGFDSVVNRAYIGGDGSTVCYLDYVDLTHWPDYPSPLWGVPGWISTQVPQLRRVNGVAVPFAPVFAGRGGKCDLQPYYLVDGAFEIHWDCLTAADGLPFDDIRGYDVLGERLSDEPPPAEWFMSADSVASYGLGPEDRLYAIPELVGEAEARPTWLSASRDHPEGVWVGTNGYGLLHVDPYTPQVTRYTTADGLPGDDVRDVQVCGTGCVWVATSQGLGHWDGTHWQAYTTADGLPSDDVYGVSPDNYYAYYQGGDVWAATAGGAALLFEGTEVWQPLPDLPPGVQVNGVMYGSFSARGQGLFRFVRGAAIEGRATRYTTADGLPDDRVTALAATANGLLVGTPSGAVEWDGQAWTLVTGAPVNDASSTSIATEAGLWVWGEGWQKVDGQRVLRVAEGGWYATPSQVCRWREGQAECPTTFEGQPLTNTQALSADPAVGTVGTVDGEGRGWVYDATAGDGGQFVPYRADFAPRRVNDLALAAGVWSYASPEGLYQAACELGDCTALDDKRLAGGWPIGVRGVSTDAATGRVWVATRQGAFYREALDRDKVQDWTHLTGLFDPSSRDLTSVLPLPDGTVWLGTANAGVIYFEPEW